MGQVTEHGSQSVFSRPGICIAFGHPQSTVRLHATFFQTFDIVLEVALEGRIGSAKLWLADDY